MIAAAARPVNETSDHTNIDLEVQVSAVLPVVGAAKAWSVFGHLCQEYHQLSSLNKVSL